MSVAFLHPGQGAQIPGMLHQLPDRAEATWTLQEASQVLGRDVLTLDTEQALSSTVPVQLALFVSGVAATRIMHAEGVEPDVLPVFRLELLPLPLPPGPLPLRTV
jgi:malonate decarboxylase epsilon subunit